METQKGKVIDQKTLKKEVMKSTSGGLHRGFEKDNLTIVICATKRKQRVFLQLVFFVLYT